MRHSGHIVAIAASVALLPIACASTFETEVEDVAVRAGGLRLEIENSRSAPIYYFLVERNTAATIDWVPCVDPETCPSVAAGALVRIPYRDIPGWEPHEAEAILYWWHLVERDPALEPRYEADRIRSIDLRLE